MGERVMPWVRLDDAFYDNAKFSDLTNAGVGAWVKLLAFASRNLTDGHIRKAFAVRLASRKELAELVGAGLLEQTDTGWLIHDFLDFQPDSAAVLARREKERERWRNRAHSAETPPGGTAEEPDTPPPLQEDSIATPTYPVPDPLPIPKETNDFFDEFWTAYPRKLGKPEARKAWTRALRKASADTIVASLSAWCVSWTDPRFIPHPSTWLNREQWNDAPVASASSNGHGPDLEVAAALAKFAGDQ